MIWVSKRDCLDRIWTELTCFAKAYLLEIYSEIKILKVYPSDMYLHLCSDFTFSQAGSDFYKLEASNGAVWE